MVLRPDRNAIFKRNINQQGVGPIIKNSRRCDMAEWV
ncbi:MAG: hypothetical protein ACJAR1_000641 [Rubritalea sp.]|jgi:hypothetical protein